jgi:hypothetical protein
MYGTKNTILEAALTFIIMMACTAVATIASGAPSQIPKVLLSNFDEVGYFP